MTENTTSIYQSAIRKSFAFLKRTKRIDELLVKQIPLPDGLGVLLPICELHADDSHLIEDLSSWRRSNQVAYPTRFPVTTEGTS